MVWAANRPPLAGPLIRLFYPLSNSRGRGQKRRSRGGICRVRHKQKRSDRSGLARHMLAERVADEARFIKTWFENPLVTGAVSPSGRKLACAMARFVDPAIPGPIIELGPGTGPVTEALVRRGVTADRLVLVEYDPAFCQLLAGRYPTARIINGDAYNSRAALQAAMQRPAAAVVSSLPLLTKPEMQRLRLLNESFGLMGPEGVFVQFTYGITSPMPRKIRGTVVRGVAFECSAPVWFNLPPARVWAYRRTESAVTLDRQLSPPLLGRIRSGTEKMQDELKVCTEKVKAGLLERTEKVRADIKATTARVRSARSVKPALDLLERIGDRNRRRNG
jgi:phosphatidylethanolamine/phosphatidyl-N-methylethanolamine N-methyltransferase